MRRGLLILMVAGVLASTIAGGFRWITLVLLGIPMIGVGIWLSKAGPSSSGPPP